MVFVGYEIASKAYRLWNPKTHKIVVSVNVKFDETVLPNKPSITPAPVVTTTTPKYVPPHKRATTVDIPWLFVDEEKAKPSTASTSKGKQRAISPPSSSSSSSSSSSDSESEDEQPVPPSEPTVPTPPPDTPHVSPKSPERTLPSTPPNQGPSQALQDAPTKSRKSKRQPKQVEKYVAGTSGLGSAETEGDEAKQLERFERTYCQMVELYTSTSTPNEPKSYEDAKASADASKWISAMKEEIDTLEKRSTWEVVKRPKDKPVVSCKWVYHMKLNEAGEIVRYKARLVARGFSQTYGVDYKDTFAPVTRLETLRLMFVLAVEQNWEIRQIDVKNAYLYGDLDEEIYMEAAKGMDIPKGKVLRLKKALYGLKQAGRAWYTKLRSIMKQFGLTQVPCEPHLFAVQKTIKQREYTLIVPIYMVNLFPIGDKILTDQFEEYIGKYLDITILGNASFFLGIHVTRNRTTIPPSLTIDQEVYAISILEKHNMNMNKISHCLMSQLGATCVERQEEEPKASSE